MPQKYDPRTHVFAYGSVSRTATREANALDQFCRRMRRTHGAKYKPMSIAKALSNGLVVNVDGTSVDGVLDTPAGFVAVELLAYSPLGDRGDVLALDLALRRAIKPALFGALAAKPCSLSLSYASTRRPGPTFATVKTVPVEKLYPAVIAELAAIVEDIDPLEFNRFLSFRFAKSENVAVMNRYGGTRYLDASRFPICAAHFDRIRFQGLNAEMTPQVDSDLHGGSVGVDEEWVRRFLLDKSKKSLNKSRARANGLPLWLIVHSDGHAIHQTIPAELRSRAVALCRDVLRATQHAFSRVYWADRTGYVDAAWVGRVL
jgi:hypothetical protein